MKHTIIEFDPELVHGPADDLPRARSAGLHCSQVYASLEEKINGPQKNNFSLGQLKVYRAAGFIWERVMSAAFADALVNDEWQRPGEFWCEGISCSPDLISQSRWVLGETKFTWKSIKQLDELLATGSGGLWVWLVQIKAYCHVINTRQARLFAFFVNGNYAPPVPILRVVDMEFTDREIRENWDMLKSHARKKGWL